jgi:hypothetical protein
MTEAVTTSETSVNFYKTKRSNIPEDSLHTHRRENLKSQLHEQLRRGQVSLPSTAKPVGSGLQLSKRQGFH